MSRPDGGSAKKKMGPGATLASVAQKLPICPDVAATLKGFIDQKITDLGAQQGSRPTLHHSSGPNVWFDYSQ